MDIVPLGERDQNINELEERTLLETFPLEVTYIRKILNFHLMLTHKSCYFKYCNNYVLSDLVPCNRTDQ